MLKYNPLHCFFAMRHTIRSLWKGTSVGRITAKLVSGTEHSRLASYIFLNTLRWVILQQLKLTYKHWSYSWIIAMHSALKFWYSSKVWLYLWFCAGKQQFPHCISILRNVINLNRPVGLSLNVWIANSWQSGGIQLISTPLWCWFPPLWPVLQQWTDIYHWQIEKQVPLKLGGESSYHAAPVG